MNESEKMRGSQVTEPGNWNGEFGPLFSGVLPQFCPAVGLKNHGLLKEKSLFFHPFFPKNTLISGIFKYFSPFCPCYFLPNFAYSA